MSAVDQVLKEFKSAATAAFAIERELMGLFGRNLYNARDRARKDELETINTAYIEALRLLSGKMNDAMKLDAKMAAEAKEIADAMGDVAPDKDQQQSARRL